MVITRFADDFVVGFEYREDADRFWADLRERLAKFSLELNAEKTRLIRFGRFAAQQRKERGLGKPETFQFLGFTHICGKTRKGRFVLRRITDSKRSRAKLHALRGELLRRRDQPIQSRDAGSPVSCAGTPTITACRVISGRCTPSAPRPSGAGSWRYGVAASAHG